MNLTANWGVVIGWTALAGAGLVSILALWLLWWALWRDRARGRPRCPRCWYDLQGASDAGAVRCPECGHTAGGRALLRTRRRWRWAGAGLAVLLATWGGLVFGGYRQNLLNLLLPRWWPTTVHMVGGYTVRMYYDRASGFGKPAQLRISKGGVTYLTLEDWNLELGATTHDEPPFGIGQDITGDQVPDLVITGYSGGAHCCFSYTVISLENDAARVVAHLPAAHGGVRFVDLDGDKTAEVRINDWTFAYWNTSFVESPAPDVVLRWNGQGYVLAPDLMAAEPLRESLLQERVQDVRAAAAAGVSNLSQAGYSGHAPPLLWRTMLELIYTGHPGRAQEFFDAAWPATLAGKAEFAADLEQQLHASPYWPALRLVELYTRPNE